MLKPNAKATIEGFANLTADDWCLLNAPHLQSHRASAAMKLNKELATLTYRAFSREEVQQRMDVSLIRFQYLGGTSNETRAFLTSLLDSVYEPEVPE